MEHCDDKFSHHTAHCDAATDGKDSSNAECALGYRSLELAMMQAALMDLVRKGICKIPYHQLLSKEHLMIYYGKYFQPSIKIERIDNVIFNHREKSRSDSDDTPDNDSANDDGSLDSAPSLRTVTSATRNESLTLHLQQTTEMNEMDQDGKCVKVSRWSTVRPLLSEVLDYGQTREGLTQLSHRVKTSLKRATLAGQDKEAVLERTKRILAKSSSGKGKRQRLSSGRSRGYKKICSVTRGVKLEHSHTVHEPANYNKTENRRDHHEQSEYMHSRSVTTHPGGCLEEGYNECHQHENQMNALPHPRVKQEGGIKRAPPPTVGKNDIIPRPNPKTHGFVTSPKDSTLIPNLTNGVASGNPFSKDDVKFDEHILSLRCPGKTQSTPKRSQNKRKSTTIAQAPRKLHQLKNSSKGQTNGNDNDVAQAGNVAESSNESKLPDLLRVARQNITRNHEVATCLSDSQRLTLDLPRHNWLENKYQMQQRNIKLPAMTNTSQINNTQAQERAMGATITSHSANLSTSLLESRQGLIKSARAVQSDSPHNDPQVPKSPHIGDDNIYCHDDQSQRHPICMGLAQSRPEHPDVLSCKSRDLDANRLLVQITDSHTSSDNTLKKSSSDISPLSRYVCPIQETYIKSHQSSLTTANTESVKSIPQQSSSFDKDLSVQNDGSSSVTVSSIQNHLMPSVSSATVTQTIVHPTNSRSGCRPNNKISGEDKMQSATNSLKSLLTTPLQPILPKRKRIDAVTSDIPPKKCSKADTQDQARLDKSTVVHSDKVLNSLDEVDLVISDVFSLSADSPKTTDQSSLVLYLNSVLPDQPTTQQSNSLLADNSHLCTSFGDVIDEVLTTMQKQDETCDVPQLEDQTPPQAQSVLTKLSIVESTSQPNVDQDLTQDILVIDMPKDAPEKTTHDDKYIEQTSKSIPTETVENDSMTDRSTDDQSDQFEQHLKSKGSISGKVVETGASSKLQVSVQNNHVEGTDNRGQARRVDYPNTVPTTHKAAHYFTNVVIPTTATAGNIKTDAHLSQDVRNHAPSVVHKELSNSIHMVSVPKDGLATSATDKNLTNRTEDMKSKFQEYKKDEDAQARTSGLILELCPGEDLQNSNATMDDSNGTNASSVARLVPVMNVQPNNSSKGDSCNIIPKQSSCSKTISIQLQSLKGKVLEQERELKTLEMLAKMKEKEKQIISDRIQKVQSDMTNMKSTLSEVKGHEQTGPPELMDCIDLTPCGDLRLSQLEDKTIPNPRILDLTSKPHLKLISAHQETTAHLKNTDVEVESPPTAISVRNSLSVNPSTTKRDSQQEKSATDQVPIYAMKFPTTAGDKSQVPCVSVIRETVNMTDPHDSCLNEAQEHMQATQSTPQPISMPVKTTRIPDENQQNVKQAIQGTTTLSPGEANQGVTTETPRPSINKQLEPSNSVGSSSEVYCNLQNQQQKRIPPVQATSGPVLLRAKPTKACGSKHRVKQTAKCTMGEPKLTSHLPHQVASSSSHQTVSKTHDNRKFPLSTTTTASSLTPLCSDDSLYTSGSCQLNANAMMSHIPLSVGTHSGSRYHEASGCHPPPHVAVQTAHPQAQYRGCQSPGQLFYHNTNAHRMHFQPVISHRTENPRLYNAPRCITSNQTLEHRNGGYLSSSLQSISHMVDAAFPSSQPCSILPVTHHKQIHYPDRSLMMPSYQQVAPGIMSQPVRQHPMQLPCRKSIVSANATKKSKSPPSYTESVKFKSTHELRPMAIPSTPGDQITTKVIDCSDSRLKQVIGLRVACNLCSAPASYLCSGCALAAYCTTQCQHKDWVVHKRQCITRSDVS